VNTAERDRTEEWLLPESAKPATIAELEQRIDVALALARASEAAVMTVADAALESAEQARRAAVLAEMAAERAAGAGSVNGSAPEAAEQPTPERATPAPLASEPAPRAPTPDEWLAAFQRRADQVGARFARLS
jgi:hypothetical protein